MKSAKDKLTKKDIPPTIELVSEVGVTIVVDELTTPSGREYFVIYRNVTDTNTPLIKVPKGSYRYVYFGNLSKCRVFVKCKLLRVMFDRCDECHVSIRTPIVGLVEIYSSKLTNVSFRICKSLYPSLTTPIPLVTIEACNDIQLFQSLSEVLYLMKTSVDITGYIVEENTGRRLQNYNMGKLLWSLQEQDFITLSKEKGFIRSEFEATSLNEINHTFFVGDTTASSSSGVDDSLLLGSTPPVNTSFLDRHRQ